MADKQADKYLAKMAAKKAAKKAAAELKTKNGAVKAAADKAAAVPFKAERATPSKSAKATNARWHLNWPSSSYWCPIARPGCLHGSWLRPAPRR